MVELVDTQDLGSCVLTDVQVRVLSPAPGVELSTSSEFLAAAAAIWVQCEAMYALTSTLSRFDRFPFTAAYAIENGITHKTLRGPQYRRLFRGVYIRSDVELDRRIWLRAARLVLPPDAVVSHHTAAWLYGFDARAGRLLEFSTNSRTTTDHDGIVLHRRQSTIVPYTVDSIPVTGPDRTFVDCCHRLGFVTCVQFADHLINVGATNMATLIDYASTRHFHGVRRARRIVMYASERAESPRETLVRLMLRFARLPAVSVNLPVDAAGSARADLMFTGYNVIVEYDGWYHERSPRQRQRDHARRDYLASLGYRVVVVVDEDLRAPATVIWRVHRALVDRGYVGPEPKLNASWHRWFDNAFYQ